ncbi:hypothetical protein [Pectobacterium phage Wc4-1]|uniref:Lipoprotein n=1 Tax=Pectobacterium phage Wc4 TaxID=2652428 RepID=A0A5P8D593_9CAUD|nr:hypothetical protein [Pectobacterium phage Wc4]QFP93966.1 hypothetical protein [Pectobacterium phage Wc4-1]
MFTKKNLIIAAVVTGLFILMVSSCGSDKTEQTAQYVQPVQQAPAQQVMQQAPVQERQPVYDQNQPNVVVVQQPPQTVVQDSGGITAGHLAAGALGYFAGRSSSSNSNRGYSQRTVTNNRTTIIKQAPRQKSYFGSSSRTRTKSFTSSRRR